VRGLTEPTRLSGWTPACPHFLMTGEQLLQPISGEQLKQSIFDWFAQHNPPDSPAQDATEKVAPTKEVDERTESRVNCLLEWANSHLGKINSCPTNSAAHTPEISWANQSDS
jgi:hypothetical protein